MISALLATASTSNTPLARKHLPAVAKHDQRVLNKQLVGGYQIQYQGKYLPSRLQGGRLQEPRLTLRHQYTRAHRFRSSLCLRGLIM